MAELITFKVKHKQRKNGLIRLIGPLNLKSDWFEDEDDARVDLYHKTVATNQYLKDI